MSELARPRRVVILDADNPLREVQGEFFWVEDHERILVAARESAYRVGYDAGYAAASRHGPRRVVVRLRRSRRHRLLALSCMLLLIAAFLADVVLFR